MAEGHQERQHQHDEGRCDVEVRLRVSSYVLGWGEPRSVLRGSRGSWAASVTARSP